MMNFSLLFRDSLEGGNLEDVHALTKTKYIEINDYFDDGTTPLSNALEGNYCDFVKRLLEMKACPDAKVNPGHRGELSSPLAIAVRNKCIPNIRLLLKHGANIDCRDGFHRTPLHLASSIGAADIVRLLLKEGAKPNNQDHWGRAALHVLLYNLPTKTDKCNPFYRIVEYLIDKGANVNKADDHGCTPIYLCATYGDNTADICWLLIIKGAQVNLSIRRKLTPFQLACREGHIVLCKLFMSNNFANIPQCMDVAIKAGRTSIINLLVDAGYHPRYRRYAMLFPCGDVSAFPKLCTPMTLQTLCRTAICNSSIYTQLDQTEYPAKLKDYIYMRDTPNKMIS